MLGRLLVWRGACAGSRQTATSTLPRHQLLLTCSFPGFQTAAALVSISSTSSTSRHLPPVYAFHTGSARQGPASQSRPARNEEITSEMVQLLSEEGVHQGVKRVADILKTMDHETHFLVQVDTNQTPPVAKLMSKHLVYEANRMAKKMQKKAAARVRESKTKELHMKANIAEQDLEIKLNKLQQFLDKGHRVQVVIMRNTAMAKRNDCGEEIVRRILERIEECGALVVRDPVREGSNTIMLFRGKAKE